MITLCPFCSKRLKINDNLAGKRGTCPACKQVFTIPVISAEPPEGRKAARSTSLRAALSEETSRRAAEIPPTISSAASSTNVAESREVSTQRTQRSAPAPPSTCIDTAGVRPPAVPPPLSQTAVRIEINRYRHNKKKLYFVLAALLSGIVWIIVMFIAIPFLIMIFMSIVLIIPVLFAVLAILLVMWMIQQFYKAKVFGNSIRIFGFYSYRLWNHPEPKSAQGMNNGRST